jgi:phosphopantetheinyl transferase (holo-ACP synthase)
VDLTHHHAKGKSTDTRFRKRVFLPDEERFILADVQPDAMLWAFWTGKEAAYKAVRKDYADIPSIPRLYRVSLEKANEADNGYLLRQGKTFLIGTVETPQGNICLETTIAPDYVHSIATAFFPTPGENIVFQVNRMLKGHSASSAYESWYVRAAAKKRLSRYLHGETDDIEIRRDKGPGGIGPPYVYFQKQTAPIDISLSHDGAFAAYAFTVCPQSTSPACLEII